LIFGENMRRLVTLALALLLMPAAFAPAQPKPPDVKDKPKIVVALPLGVVPGKTSKLTLRGLRIDTATEIHLHDPKSSAKLLTKTKVGVPNGQDAAQVGDSQLEIEVTLPEDYPMTSLSLSVVTPAGESPPYRLLVDPEVAIAEKEPNNSFKTAQPIGLPQSVDGVIGQPQDVDVFRFEGKEGQAVVVEVFAARYGSPLDSFLTLYTAEGQIVASNDDHGGSADSRIEVTLPKTAVYYVSLIDANDQGGPAFVYRLAVRTK
jgi:Bacterial pre-peptidase C-terminal domain